MEDTVAHHLSQFVVETKFASLPDEVQEMARARFVDTLGVILAGCCPDERSGVIVRNLVARWGDSGGATVVGLIRHASPRDAALLNGTLAQALEMDDKHGPSLARPGSSVIPAALAVAEADGLAFEDLLEAIVVGYEVMIRLGYVASDRFLERGYHTSALLGGFGAVAAVGKLRQESPQTIVDGFGIVGTFASGIQESTRTGSLSKVLHGGWGAQAGITAMDLAASGITGPPSIFEGKFGFFRTFLFPQSEDLEWDRALSDLKSTWHLLDTATKPYPCCQLLHSFIVAAEDIYARIADAGDTSSIERIECRLAEPGRTLVTEPAERKRSPSDPHDARFSLPYVVGHVLAKGTITSDAFRVQSLDDVDVLRLSQRIVTLDDPESDYPDHCPAYIEVRTAASSYSRRVKFHPGCTETPLSEDEFLRKFESNSSWRIEQARDIARRLLGESRSTTVDDLLSYVSPVDRK